MQIVRRQRLLLTLCGIAALGIGGCADMDILPTWVPFQGAVSDPLPGVVTPAQRIAELRKWSAEAAKATPQQKQAISEQLAVSIRTEKDPLIRAEIIRTLGAYPSASADGILKAAMNDPDTEVRIAACDAWGKRHDDQAVELLGAAMNGDVASEVRLTAAKALGDTQNPAAVKPLGNALTDADPAMQYLAVLSLKKVTGKDFGNDVNRWQQYVRDGTPPPPPSWAERLRQWF
jgi:HEAT repeat protein